MLMPLRVSEIIAIHESQRGGLILTRSGSRRTRASLNLDGFGARFQLIALHQPPEGPPFLLRDSR